MNLSYATQGAFLERLVSLADRCQDLEKDLLENGWAVFQPQIAFEQSFGQSASELSEWRIVTSETVKVRIATPNIRYHIGGPPYKSPILETLRKSRDELLGHPYRSSSDPFWARELDSCRRKLEKFRIEYPDEFAVRFASVRHEERRRREFEISQSESHAACTQADFSKIVGCYRQVMEKNVVSLGFKFDQRRSTNERSIYSKCLIEDWYLCLSPEPLEWFENLAEGDVLPLLSLQKDICRGRLCDQSVKKFLLIEYDKLVYHFDVSYKVFRDVLELEVVLKARLFLLSRVLQEIESALVTSLRLIG